MSISISNEHTSSSSQLLQQTAPYLQLLLQLVLQLLDLALLLLIGLLVGSSGGLKIAHTCSSVLKLTL